MPKKNQGGLATITESDSQQEGEGLAEEMMSDSFLGGSTEQTGAEPDETFLGGGSEQGTVETTSEVQEGGSEQGTVETTSEVQETSEEKSSQKSTTGVQGEKAPASAPEKVDSYKGLFNRSVSYGAMEYFKRINSLRDGSDNKGTFEPMRIAAYLMTLDSSILVGNNLTVMLTSLKDAAKAYLDSHTSKFIISGRGRKRKKLAKDIFDDVEEFMHTKKYSELTQIKEDRFDKVERRWINKYTRKVVAESDEEFMEKVLQGDMSNFDKNRDEYDRVEDDSNTAKARKGKVASVGSDLESLRVKKTSDSDKGGAVYSAGDLETCNFPVFCSKSCAFLSLVAQTYIKNEGVRECVSGLVTSLNKLFELADSVASSLSHYISDGRNVDILGRFDDRYSSVLGTIFYSAGTLVDILSKKKNPIRNDVDVLTAIIRRVASDSSDGLRNTARNYILSFISDKTDGSGIAESIADIRNKIKTVAFNSATDENDNDTGGVLLNLDKAKSMLKSEAEGSEKAKEGEKKDSKRVAASKSIVPGITKILRPQLAAHFVRFNTRAAEIKMRDGNFRNSMEYKLLIDEMAAAKDLVYQNLMKNFAFEEKESIQSGKKTKDVSMKGISGIVEGIVKDCLDEEWSFCAKKIFHNAIFSSYEDYDATMGMIESKLGEKGDADLSKLSGKEAILYDTAGVIVQDKSRLGYEEAIPGSDKKTKERVKKTNEEYEKAVIMDSMLSGDKNVAMEKLERRGLINKYFRSSALRDAYNVFYNAPSGTDEKAVAYMKFGEVWSKEQDKFKAAGGSSELISWIRAYITPEYSHYFGAEYQETNDRLRDIYILNHDIEGSIHKMGNFFRKLVGKKAKKFRSKKR